MRALIVDDEELARRRLRELLAQVDGVELVGESADVAAAAADVRRLAPDLVFLDVMMPEADGFALLAQLGEAAAPAVVFVTAHAAHAVEAFRVDAVDYLLKPFDLERLQEAVARVRRDLEHRRAASLGRELVRRMADAPPARPPRLALRAVGRVAFVEHDEIEWIDADGNGARVHTRDATYSVNEPLGALEAKLAGGRFLRSHRSTLVNLDRVREREIGPHGDYVLVLASGRRLSVGRSHREEVRRVLEGG